MGLTNDQLESLRRERAFDEDAELHVERREDQSHEWIAGFEQYNAAPAEVGTVRLKSAEAATKREALEALASLTSE